MTDSNVIYGHCGTPIKTQESPEQWEVVVDYYPESRSFIPYYFNSEKEAVDFYKKWKQNESDRS